MQTDLDFKMLKKIESKGQDYFKLLVSYTYQHFCDKDVKPFIMRNGKKHELGFFQMATIMKNITESAGITPSSEQWIYILSNKKRILCEACAGSGKTTISLFKIICIILFYGVRPDEVLALAYNKHAAEDLETKFMTLRDKINAIQIPGIKIEGTIVACTFHSWCRTWLDAYKEFYGYEDMRQSQLGEYEQSQLFQVAFKNMCTVNKKDITPDDNLIQSFMALFSYTKERCITKDPEAWKICSEFQNLKEFSTEEITQVFKFYSRLKKNKRKFDYVDLVDKMYDIVLDIGKSKRIRANYKMVLIDEYQDMTYSMKRIPIALLEGNHEHFIGRYDDCFLSCIGDGDQSIYSFRGTQPDNCLLFKEEYKGKPEDVRILTMSVNRRCKSEVLQPAIKVVSSIGDRIDKPISALNQGGRVLVKEYRSQDEEVNDILQFLQGKQNCSDCCVAYRNISSSKHLIMKCFELDIPCNVVKGTVPLTDKMSETLRGVLDLLYDPYNLRLAQKYLYRVVPKGTAVKRDTLFKVFQTKIEAIENSTRGNYVAAQPFWELEIPGSNEIRDYDLAIEVLKGVSLKMSKGANMNEFFPEVFNLVMRYYIQGLMQSFMQSEFSQEFLNFIYRFFNKPIPYKKLKQEIRDHLEFQERNKSRGVYLTTMHGLKGLEFENVFVIDLIDGLFPGNELRNPALTAVQRNALELEARRLLYVTVTRAKTNLTLYFSKTQPSRYLKYFVEDPQVEMYAEHLAKLQEGAPESVNESGYYFNEDWRYNSSTAKMTFNQVVENYKEMNPPPQPPQPQPSKSKENWKSSSVSIPEAVNLMAPQTINTPEPVKEEVPETSKGEGLELSSIALSEFMFTDESIKSSIDEDVHQTYDDAENKFLTIEQKLTFKPEQRQVKEFNWEQLDNTEIEFESETSEDDEWTLGEEIVEPLSDEAPDTISPEKDESLDIKSSEKDETPDTLDAFLEIGEQIEKEQNPDVSQPTKILETKEFTTSLGDLFDENDLTFESSNNDTFDLGSIDNDDFDLGSLGEGDDNNDAFDLGAIDETETSEFNTPKEEEPVIKNKPNLSRVLGLIKKRKEK